MKRIILLITVSLMASAAFAEGGVSNGGVPPDGWPQTLLIRNVPMGSGIPQTGITGGYSRAEYVNDGLYHVPTYIHGRGTNWDRDPIVVQLNCQQSDISSAVMDVHWDTHPWVCEGFSIDSEMGSSANILIQPVFVK